MKNITTLKTSHAKHLRNDNLFNDSIVHIMFACIIYLFCFIQTAHSQSIVRETLGGVGIDISLAHVIQSLGQADSRTKEFYDEDAHCWVRVHFYDKAGIEVEVCRIGRNYNVRSLRIVKSEIAATSKGIRVGSTVSQIMRTYRKARMIEDHSVLIEDRVRGIVLRFLVENKKVYEINLYKDETLLDRPVLHRRAINYISQR